MVTKEQIKTVLHVGAHPHTLAHHLFTIMSFGIRQLDQIYEKLGGHIHQFEFACLALAEEVSDITGNFSTWSGVGEYRRRGIATNPGRCNAVVHIKEQRNWKDNFNREWCVVFPDKEKEGRLRERRGKKEEGSEGRVCRLQNAAQSGFRLCTSFIQALSETSAVYYFGSK